MLSENNHVISASHESVLRQTWATMFPYESDTLEHQGLGAPPKRALIKAVNKSQLGHSDSLRNQVKDEWQEDYQVPIEGFRASFLQKSPMIFPASLEYSKSFLDWKAFSFFIQKFVIFSHVLLSLCSFLSCTFSFSLFFVIPF